MTYQQAVLPSSLEGVREMVLRRQEVLARGVTPRHSTADRRAYIEDLPYLEHPALQATRQVAVEWIRLNAKGRPIKFLTIDAPFVDAKSETANALITEVAQESWAEVGYEVRDDLGLHRILPAVAVNVGVGAELALAQAMADALGIPHAISRRSKATADGLLADVAAACCRARTRLMVLDEAQNLASGRGVHMTTFLKRIVTLLPVTVLFVGNALHETPLLKASTVTRYDEAAVVQLRKREVRLPFAPIKRDAAGIKGWLKLVSTAVDDLPLRNASEMSPQDLAWFMSRCDDSRGTALEFIRRAAVEAVGREEAVCLANLRRVAPDE